MAAITSMELFADVATSPIAVAILEDHAVVRDGLSLAIRPPNFTMLVNTGDPERFLQALKLASPRSGERSVALVDITLRTCEGIELPDGVAMLERMRQCAPAFAPLVLSASDEPELVQACARAGAHGFLRKADATFDELTRTLVAVAHGGHEFPASLPGLALREPHHQMLSLLTAREREVLALVAGGADNLKIAALLSITERTVKAHVAGIYRKVEVVENRVQLAVLARDLGVWPRYE